MKIADLDYYSLYGKTVFHRIPASYKLLVAFTVICSVVLIKNLTFFLILYLTLFSMIVFSKLPKMKPILLSFYSLIFVLIFIFSFHNISIENGLTIIFKVLCVSTTFAIIILTTPIIKIFEILSKFLPSFLTDALYLTYRSVFLLIDIFENLKLASYIRGSVKIRNPIKWLKYVGNSIGFLVIKSIESSEKFYDTLRIRGYSGKFQSIRQANGKNR
jgi:cobalt/nickel transport system permease protein